MMVQIGKPNMYNKVICTAFFLMIKMLHILNRYCSDKNIRCFWKAIFDLFLKSKDNIDIQQSKYMYRYQ